MPRSSGIPTLPVSIPIQPLTTLCLKFPYNMQRLSSGPYLGQSSCQTKIFVDTAAATNCSHKWPNNTLTRFACPFDQLSSQPCGKKAYHNFPPQFQWSGCCHPSIVTTDIKILRKKNIQSTMHSQAHKDMAGLPSKFEGYTLADPWTSPSADVGWSLFLGGGTNAALNKINGIAWSVLSLANHTDSPQPSKY